MEEALNISQELKTIAPSLEAIGRVMPYQVPDEYFDMLPVMMLAKLATPLEKPVVPEGYFEEFSDVMLAKVHGIEVTNELEETAPVLNTISKASPYHVPDGYFENLSIQPSSQSAPVIPLKRKSKAGMWAAAACATALAGLLAWQFLWNSPTVAPGNDVANNSIDTATIQLATALTQLEDNSLNNELNENGIPAESQSALYYLDTENFETALHDFSDKELSDHLVAVQTVVKEKS